MPFSTGDENLLQINQEQFDFGVQFEQLFFSVIPSVLFIFTSLWRTLSQARKPALVDAPIFQFVKVVRSCPKFTHAQVLTKLQQVAIAIYFTLELTLLLLATVGSFQVTTLFIAASSLNLVSALLMATLSVIDHSRSPRPSVLLNVYLSLTLLLDISQARTLFLSSTSKQEITYSSLFTATVAFKAIVLLLEAKTKARWVRWDDKEHSPEETSSVFSLGVLFWLNGLFRLGHSKVLKTDDLYPLDINMDAKTLHEKFAKNIDHSKLKGHKYGLLAVLVRTLKVPLLLPLIPRLCMLGFTFCQPLLLERLIDYLSEPELDPNVGYGFIGAAFFIYTGIAISMAFYWYRAPRNQTLEDYH
jgi:hypothetical protein